MIYNKKMRNLEFINSKKDIMRNSERKVAECILSSPDTIIHSTISELAEKAGVSDPTVIRFCRCLGFSGYQEFKIHLAQALIPQLHNIHEDLDGTEQAPALLKKVFHANIVAIQNSLETLNYSEVQQAISLISVSNKIIFFGVGGSAAVAKDAYHKFFRIGIPCQWFEDTHMATMAASMMTKGEIFFAISHSGNTKDIVEALGVANKTGAETIALVTALNSPVSKVSRHVLRVYANETNVKFEPMSSRMAQLSVIDALSVGISMQRSNAVLDNLQKSRIALIDKRY